MATTQIKHRFAQATGGFTKFQQAKLFKKTLLSDCNSKSGIQFLNI